MAAPLDKVKAFLRKTPPFAYLPEQALDWLVPRLKMEYFPKGEVFIHADETPLDHLYLIDRGAVKLFLKKRRVETLVDLRAEGDIIGAAALIDNSPPPYNAAAVEDVICYLAPRRDFLELAGRHPQFRLFSGRILSGEAADSPLQSESSGASQGEEAMFSTTVGQVVRRPPVFCYPLTTIREAAGLMTRENVGAMVVVDQGRRPTGIFTRKDLTAFIAGPNPDPDRPVREIMKTGAVSIPSDQLCFEASMILGRRGIRHLPIVDQGRLTGVVTLHDLLLLQGNAPASILKDIGTAPDLERLAMVQHSLDRLVEVLVRQGVGAAGLQEVITLINDRLTRRLIEISLAEMEKEGRGAPPVGWAWVGAGSAGRSEQIMRTDQDCAIVYDNPPSGLAGETREFFLALAARVVTGLEQCGFPRCREMNMADNPEWNRPASEWLDFFRNIFNKASREMLPSAALLFDARLIYGRDDIVHQVMRLVRTELLDARVFLNQMAAAALRTRPPIGFFRQFVLERSGDQQKRLDLKSSGIQPLADAVRVLALEKRLRQTNTLDRILALEQSGGLPAGLAEETRNAFSFLFMLRIQNYLTGRSLNRFSFDRISPELLDPARKKALKEAFRSIGRLQDALAERFDL